MYIPGSFLETDATLLSDLIARHPLGMLFSAGKSGLMVSPLPFHYRVLEGKPTLVAHLARANPHWGDLLDLKECLVVFKGAENYITPSWYANKQTTHRVVPTWNYEVVQVKGIPRIMESAAWLNQQVSELTDSLENRRYTPWKVDDAPKDYIESQLKAIVGLEIEILEILGKWKMSQNRTAEDAQGVVKGLSDPEDPHSNAEVARIVHSKMGG